MKNAVLKLSGLALLAAGIAGSACAAFGGLGAPEIDAATGVNALALLGGAILVVRSARRK